MFNNLFKKIKRISDLPLSRKQQYLVHSYLKLKGIVLYRHLFKKFGQGSILKNTLFISYEAVSIGKDVLIWDDARIEVIDCYSEQSIKPSIIIGDGVVIQQGCHITAASTLNIGSNTSILFDVLITDIDHEYQTLNIPMSKQPLKVAKTTIGENCFIGSGAKINAGTTLGKHCIVGASAVVRGSFSDYCVIVGIPGKVIKRYNPESKLWQKTDAQGDFI
jgi:acetyltransferase-like isoleucine patch superfamily enzyme